MKRQWMIGALAMVALVVAATAAPAQRTDSQLRTVRGAVVDKDDNLVPTGVVYLSNLRSRTVKTYIADNNGQYRFSGLDPNVDYEIHAEHNDMTSAKRTVSSFDSRREIVINLKLDKNKDSK